MEQAKSLSISSNIGGQIFHQSQPPALQIDNTDDNEKDLLNLDKLKNEAAEGARDNVETKQ